MRFHTLLVFLGVSFVTTVRSSVLVYQDSALIAPPSGICSERATLRAQLGEYYASTLRTTPVCQTGTGKSVQSIPTIQKFNTGRFRNQPAMTQAAYDRGTFYWVEQRSSNKWVVFVEPILNDELPGDICFEADHIFELQMLTIWLNARGKKSTYFNEDNMKAIKKTINGAPNGALIPKDLNRAKGAVVPGIMESAVRHDTCNNLQQGQVSAYMSAMESQSENFSLSAVITKISNIIRQVGVQGDAEDFARAAVKAVDCLMGRFKG